MLLPLCGYLCYPNILYAVLVVASAQASHLETHSMAVDQLVRFFELHLGASIVALLESALKGGFALGLNDVVTMLGFVDQNTYLCLANLDYPTRDSKVLQLVVTVILGATHRHNAWHCQGYQWFVPWEDRNLAIRRR
jgi:hypothetical protein